MKNFLKITSAMLVVLMLLSVFISCDLGSQTPEEAMANMTDKEKSDYLSEKSDEYYKNGYVIDMNASATVSGTMLGVNMSGDFSTTAKKTFINKGNDNFEFLSVENTVSSTTASGKTEVEKYVHTEGFSNGFAYYATVSEDESTNTIRYKSESTPAQYATYLEKLKVDDPDFNLTKSCQTVTVNKNDDGTLWVLTFSDIADGNTLSETWGDMLRMIPVDLKISNFTAVMYVDATTLALKSSKIDIELVVKEDDCDMKLVITFGGKFTLPNTTESLVPADVDSYKETGDLISAYYATTELVKLICSDDASATLSISMKLNQINGSSTTALTTYKESDKINYAEIDGKFKYHIDADVSSSGSDDYKLVVKNDGTTQTILQNGSPYSTTTQTKLEAKSFINSTLSAFNLDIDDDVTDIETTKLDNGDTRVQMELYMSNNILNSFASIGFDTNKLTNAVYNIVVIIDKDNNIVSASLKLEGSNTINSVKYTYIQMAKLSDIGTADKTLLGN